MQDENYKNGYHDGYAEALITLRAMVMARKEEHTSFVVKNNPLNENLNFGLEKAYEDCLDLIDKMLK